MKKFLYSLFMVSAIIFIISAYFENQAISVISKSIPLLILIYLIKWNSTYNRLVGSGLIFSLAGDVILEASDLFVFGLAAFLIAHICYIIAFSKKSARPALLSSILSYAYGIVMFLFLYPNLGAMTIPVVFYILVISTMLWRAYVQKDISTAGKWAFLGALLFTISDSALAINIFHGEFLLSSLMVMLTYWGAQFLIYWSTVNQTGNN